MAEGLLQREMDRRGVSGSVTSAGLVYSGEPAERFAIKVLGFRGIDIAPHRSRVIEGEMLAAADLVLGMERRHVREAVVMMPQIMPKAFTLKELVRRGESVGPRGDLSLDEWLREVAGDRAPHEHLGESPEDDITDPLGGVLDDFDVTAHELEELLERLADLLWPVPTPAASDTRSRTHGGT